jgi:hypothetical protein
MDEPNLSTSKQYQPTDIKEYRVILIYCRGFLAYNVQIGRNKIKLLMGYESVIQKVLLFVEVILQSAT